MPKNHSANAIFQSIGLGLTPLALSLSLWFAPASVAASEKGSANTEKSSSAAKSKHAASSSTAATSNLKPTAIYPHAMEAIGNVRQVYDGALTPEMAVATFRNIDRLFPVNKIRAADAQQVLVIPPASSQQVQSITKLEWNERGRRLNLDQFYEANRIAGILVLKNGQRVLEHYRYGNTPQTRWMSMSIAKSITSTLLGAAIKQGKIKSVNDSVVSYVPELKNSGYRDASIRDVLMMASGVAWNETYADPRSDRRRLLEAQIAQKPGAVFEVLRQLPRVAEPGTVANYNTGETQIAAYVLRKAIGVSLSDYLSERIWQKVGMEADAYWWLDAPNGVEIGGSGIAATLRDYGRFALFMLAQGKAKNEMILPDGWTYEATTPRQLKNGRPLAYGYLWWPATNPDGLRDAAYAAIGIHGQAMYLNPKTQTVVVLWGAQTQATGGAGSDYWTFFSAVNAALR